MNKDTPTLKDNCFRHVEKSSIFIMQSLVPKTRKYTQLTYTLAQQKLLPYARQKLQATKTVLLTLHNKQHWAKRCGRTMFENSIGLAMAMLSTKIVQHFVEVREFSNFWGLFATRPVVSEATYETLSFSIEFVIALMVFTMSEHLFEKYRNRQSDQA